jgi:hypothetical protein
MAANTTVNIGLQARDWELLFGIIFNTGDIDMLELQYALSAVYRNPATKPTVNTQVVTVATIESTLIRIAEFLNGNTVKQVDKDLGAASPYLRIMTAVRAANNVADNYISNTLATADNNYQGIKDALRANGRKYIMIAQYDGQ